jgi:lipopolysaccharide export system protein LptA
MIGQTPFVACSIVAGLLALGVVASAAQSRVIELKSAQRLEGKRIGDEEVQELIGNVHFVQTAKTGDVIKVWCDRALRYLKQNKVELFGNVQLIREDVMLRAPEGVYFGDARRAEMTKGVTLRRRSMLLTSKSGQYVSDEKRAVFVGDVVVVDSTSTTRCETLTYFEADEQSIAVGRVKVSNAKNSVTIFGDSLLHFEQSGYTVVPKRPRLVQIDTTSDGTVDTLVVVSKRMEAFRQPSERFIATDSVLVVRADLAARCERATFLPNEDRIHLEQQPVVWYGRNQVTGDTIIVTLEERKLKSVLVRGRAMAISRSDSLYPKRFDQLVGRELTMLFEERKLKRIEARRNAVSLYYLFDDGRPNGVNKTSGDRIRVDFNEGKVDNMTIVGGVEGQYIPENMIDRREEQYNLEGFRWIERRPTRRQLEIIP